ncbi:hypothetical protein [Halostagnicola kamekurae]|nr:hypothetical protein [Halostagnicola kamekurae]
MMQSWVDASVRIARIEWRRRQREAAAGTQRTRRRVTLVATVALAVVFGALSRSAGASIATSGSIPLDVLGIGVTLLFGVLAMRSSNLAHARFEGLEPAFLLTTVPTRAPALGLLVFVFARIGVFLVGPAAGVAVGAALGLRSPLVAPTMLVAIAGITALAVAVGVAGRLAAQLIGRRLSRGSFYRDLLVVFGWVPVLLAWLVLDSMSVPVGSLLERFDSLPVTWIVDLAFLGATGLGADTVRALAAIGTLTLAVPLFVGLTTVLVRRIWEQEPGGSTGPHGSHSLVTEGWIEKLLGDHVSRATLTVARERWLIERRVPRGLLSMGYAFLFVGVLVLPALIVGGSANIPLVLLAVATGLSAAIAFASDPVGTEYRVMTMLLTSVPARQFVTGLVVASTVVGTVFAVPVALIGFASPADLLAAVLIALVTVAISACAASVSIAVGLGIERYEFFPVPFFFTDVPIYAEVGVQSFVRAGSILAIVSLVAAPALLGNLEPVYELAAAIGLPGGIVQIGSILVTIALAVAVSKSAYRSAVGRYRDYQIR